eukprot:7389020-Prymnesium_polylepis.1
MTYSAAAARHGRADAGRGGADGCGVVREADRDSVHDELSSCSTLTHASSTAGSGRLPCAQI